MAGPLLGRRPFLGVLAGALVVAACGTGADDRVLVGDERHRPGDPLHVPKARAYLVAVPAANVSELLAGTVKQLHAGIRAGVLALSQKCPADGCQVSFCVSSGWFECPCHGERYSELGAAQDGRAPNGLDMYRVEITAAGDLVIDTSRRFTGLAPGSYDRDAQPTGPHCIGGPTAA